MYTGKIRQILLITDGCSNQGDDPIAMAALAKEQGITVNVIGVMEKDVIDEKGITEINEIAMFADNLGSIPPNTALMIVYDGKERHEVRISSTLKNNGTVRIRRKK